MKASSSGNKARLVLDGNQYFNELGKMLDKVAEAPPGPETYVRMAYWWFSPDCHLGGPTGKLKLLERLMQLGQLGHTVQIILWRPNSLDKTLEGLALAEGSLASSQIPSPSSGDDPEGEAKQAEGALLRQEKDHQAVAAYFAEQPNVSVFLETYDGWWGASNHQKFTLTALGGQLAVLLGGVNLADVYYADPGHEDSLWHDTAVWFQGPGTVDVEQEWLRRWNKGYTQVPVLNAQVPLAGDALKALVNQFIGTSGAPRGAQPVEATNPVDLTVATTNSESWLQREVDIQAELVTQIAKAKSYIYLENFALFDPVLVQALCDRMHLPPNAREGARATAELPELIVMIPYPDKGPTAYLNYIAYLKVALSTARSIRTPSGVIRAADCKLWTLADRANEWSSMRSVSATFTNRWMQDDALLVHRIREPHPTLVPLDSILEIDTPQAFYCASHPTAAGSDIYVHSKLALFDDAVAAIGSANYNFRSMTYDGEITAFLSGNPGVVTRVRRDLFHAYNMGEPRDWPTAAATTLDPDPDGGTRVHRLERANFQARTLEAVQFGGLEMLNFTIF